jgi:hypothetical protein
MHSAPPTPSPTELPYSFTGYHKWLDPDGYPAVAPPWGTLNAIDLNTGAYRGKIPLGEYPALAAQGIKGTGSENYGGPIVYREAGSCSSARPISTRSFARSTRTQGKLLVGNHNGQRRQHDTHYLRNWRPAIRRHCCIRRIRQTAGQPAGGRGQAPLPTNVGDGSSTGGAFIAFRIASPMKGARRGGTTMRLVKQWTQAPLILGVLALSLWPPSAFAQVTTADVVGTVSDSSGGFASGRGPSPRATMPRGTRRR